MKDYQSLQGLSRQEGKTFEEPKPTRRYQQTPLQRAQLQLQPFNNQAEQVQICIEFLKFPLGWKWIKLSKCSNLPGLTDMAGGGLGLSAAAEPLRQIDFL